MRLARHINDVQMYLNIRWMPVGIACLWMKDFVGGMYHAFRHCKTPNKTFFCSIEDSQMC